MGVANGVSSKTEVPHPRSRLRASPRTSTTLSRRRHRGRNLAAPIPATRSGIPLREAHERRGASSGPAGVSSELGGLPATNQTGLRSAVKDCRASRASTAGIDSAPQGGQAKGNAGRTGSPGSLHGVHRSESELIQAGLPDPSRDSGTRRTISQGVRRCAICGISFDLTLDHILPRLLGGTDNPSNLRWLCRQCNSMKGGRIVSDQELLWFRGSRLLFRAMGLGLTPPHFGFSRPEPVLNRLAQFAVHRGRETES